jgi:DNA replicative helicase MCM subunit Mcm2 (Cdc46/Mcm family)
VDWQRIKVQENADEVRTSTVNRQESHFLPWLYICHLRSRPLDVPCPFRGIGFHATSHSPSTRQVPAGSLPRTIDVIMRHQAVESANPGDKACFTGMLVVVPDISAMTLPGNVSVKSE